MRADWPIRLHVTRLAIPLALFTLLLLGADIHFETTRLNDGAVPRAFVKHLASADLHASVQAFWLPSAYSVAERDSELEQLESSLAAVTREFGAPSSIEAAGSSFQMYDVTVGSGPRPAWWEQEPGFVQTRQYVYSANFPRLGAGYLVVTTAASDSERVVSVSFGLPTADGRAKDRVASVFSKLLDLHGVPEDHPLRTRPIPPTHVPGLSPQ
jgi:hypothetical protein